MKTILTGVRVNEEPTLGNFLGAYKPMIDLANSGEYRVNMFVPDLHSFTTPIDHSSLQKQIIHGVKYYLAAGLNVENPKINVYRQSFVPAHSELMWILSCFTGFGELKRMTQFKEKSIDMLAGSEKVKDYSDEKLSETVNAAIVEDIEGLEKITQTSVSAGLFNYPVLMAADILLYSATYVPVGEDQYQHLEITRDIAQRMNSKFGELFLVPAPTSEQGKIMGRDQGLRIRSLTEPEKKMSKSSKNERSKISLSDDPAVAAKKIMSATTDNVGKIQFDMFNQPRISNLLQIESLLSNQPLQTTISRWTGETSYGDLKNQVATSVKTFLEDFQDRAAKITDNQVIKVLEQGETYANQTANAKLHQVQVALGLRKHA
jgi:tryptophanyl-tRNA synthetase